MRTIVSFVIGLIVLVVVVWIAVMGATGALIASRRGATPTYGFLLGALLGPLGWLVVWAHTRRSGHDAEFARRSELDDEPERLSRRAIPNANDDLNLGHDI